MRKDLFPSPGLLSSGEEWYKNRIALQQDMMRAKSAVYYIKDCEDVAVDLIKVFEAKKVKLYPTKECWQERDEKGDLVWPEQQVLGKIPERGVH